MAEHWSLAGDNYVHIYQRTGDGWKMRMLTWNDDPREWEQEKVE